MLGRKETPTSRTPESPPQIWKDAARTPEGDGPPSGVRRGTWPGAPPLHSTS